MNQAYTIESILLISPAAPLFSTVWPIRESVQQFPHPSEDDVKRLQGEEHLWHCLRVLLPKPIVLSLTFRVVSVGPVGQQSQQIIEVEIAAGLPSAGQAVRHSHYEIACVVHVPSKAPEARNKKLSSDSLRLLSPNQFVWVGLELIFLRVAGSKQIIADEEEQQGWKSPSPVGIVLDPNQVVALDREREGDEDVVSEDEHVSELLADDIPGGEHLLFVPEVVEDVQTSEKLVGDHPKRKAAQGLSLQGSEAQVQDEPEDHGHSIRHEFDIESSDAGVQLSPDPKVKAEGAVGMAIHEFTSDLPVESSLQIEEGGDQKGDDVDHRPQRPKLLGEGSHSEELDTFQTGEDSSEGENKSDGKNGEPKSIDGVGQLRSSLGLRVSFDYLRWKQDRCSTNVSVVEEVGCGC